MNSLICLLFLLVIFYYSDCCRSGITLVSRIRACCIGAILPVIFHLVSVAISQKTPNGHFNSLWSSGNGPRVERSVSLFLRAHGLEHTMDVFGILCLS